MSAAAPPPLPAAPAEAAPGARRRDLALAGALRIVDAARLVASDRALFRAALWPTLVTAVVCGALAVLASLAREGDEPPLQAFMAAFVALASMPPTILFTMWTRVGLEARRAVGAAPGELERPGERWLRVAWREGRKAVRQAALVAFGLAPVLLAVELLPFVSHSVTVALGAVWAGYWIVIDAFEIPVDLVPGRREDAPDPWFERALRAAGARSRALFFCRIAASWSGKLSRPWRQEAHFTERRPWESLGFGVAAAALLATPVLGLFFRAVAIVAATALVVEEERAGGEGEGLSSAARAASQAAAPETGRPPAPRS